MAFCLRPWPWLSLALRVSGLGLGLDTSGLVNMPEIFISSANNFIEILSENRSVMCLPIQPQLNKIHNLALALVLPCWSPKVTAMHLNLSK